MQAAGQRVPALENRPRLNRWTAPYFDAFLLLTESRTVTMSGPGPIPLSEIAAYCQLYRITDPDEVDHLIMMIRALDYEFLQWAGEKGKQKNPATAQRGLVRNNMPRRGRGRRG